MSNIKKSTIINLIMILTNISCRSLSPELLALEKATIFNISENQNAILLDGVINSSAFKKFKEITKKYPKIKMLKINICEGSMNDKINLKLAKYINENEFETHLLDNGLIASGGTDLFLAGKRRTIGTNTRIGVHSWEGIGMKATDFSTGHKYHKPYIEYYQSIGFTIKEAENFYYFTINAAPPEEVHFMNDNEIYKYKIITP